MTLAAILLALMIGLLLFGLPVSFAILVTGAAGLFVGTGIEALVGVLTDAPYLKAASFALASLPMFILMSEFLTASRFTRDLFNLGDSLVGGVRGGAAYATLTGGVLLAAVSGSSTAAAGTLASAVLPQTRRLGYDVGFSAALLASVGTLAIMIPPSLGLILYGVFTETSVGRLLLAGAVPGLLTAIAYALTIYLVIRCDPAVAPLNGMKMPQAERRAHLLGAVPILLLLAGMMLALYSGAVSPSEVGAVGALSVLLVGIVTKRLNPSSIWKATLNATRTSSMVLTIIAFSSVLAVFLALNGSVRQVIEMTSSYPPAVVLAGVLALLLVLGFFLDQLAILVLTLPLTFPLLTGLGFDPIWLGILFVKTAEIGLITPPFGLNVFVVAGASKLPVAKIFRRIWPFVFTEFLLLLVLIALPDLCLFLPRLVYGD